MGYEGQADERVVAVAAAVEEAHRRRDEWSQIAQRLAERAENE